MPIVVNCACDDMKQIERAVASIDPVDWVTIEQALPKLKSKAQGLHKLWEMGS